MENRNSRTTAKSLFYIHFILCITITHSFHSIGKIFNFYNCLQRLTLFFLFASFKKKFWKIMVAEVRFYWLYFLSTKYLYVDNPLQAKRSSGKDDTPYHTGTPFRSSTHYGVEVEDRYRRFTPSCASLARGYPRTSTSYLRNKPFMATQNNILPQTHPIWIFQTFFLTLSCSLFFIFSRYTAKLFVFNNIRKKARYFLSLFPRFSRIWELQNISI